jgi:hypothetical protein
VILGIVGVVFVEGVFQSIAVTTASAASLTESSSRTVLTRYFTDDVQQSATVGANAPATCSQPIDDGLGSWSNLMYLQFPPDPGGVPESPDVTYLQRNLTNGTGGQLARWSCTQDPASTVPVVASWPLPGSAGPTSASITCDGQPTCSPNSRLLVLSVPSRPLQNNVTFTIVAERRLP